MIKEDTWILSDEYVDVAMFNLLCWIFGDYDNLVHRYGDGSRTVQVIP